ncbi:MAG: GtrA family protein [Candidatus Diapherotrites archaeon]
MNLILSDAMLQKLIDFAVKKKQFLKFFSVGALSAVLDLSVFFVLNEFFSVDWIYAFTITFIGIGIINYSLNKSFTFKNTSNKVKTQFTVFLVIAGISYLANIFVMYLLIEFLLIWPTLARFISMWVTLVINYKAHKKITFGKIS